MMINYDSLALHGERMKEDDNHYSSSLLDQYKCGNEKDKKSEDVLTLDLLSAIRSWNLEQSFMQDEDDDNDFNSSEIDKERHAESSTISSSVIGTDWDANTATTSKCPTVSTTMSSQYTPMRKRKPYHCFGTCASGGGNYSSRPSSLTARIISDQTYLPISSKAVSPISAGIGFCKVKSKNSETCIDDDDQNSGGRVKFTRNDKIRKVEHDKNIIISSNEFQNNDRKKSGIMHHPIDPDRSCLDDSLHPVISEICHILGIPEEQYESVPFIVKRMAKVFSIHVPSLERFAKNVCDEVLGSNENGVKKTTKNFESKFVKDTNEVSEVSHKNDINLATRTEKKIDKVITSIPSTKNTGKLGMKERNQRMNAALSVLRQNRSYTPSWLSDNVTGALGDNNSVNSKGNNSKTSRHKIDSEARKYTEVVQIKNDNFSIESTNASTRNETETQLLKKKQLDGILHIEVTILRKYVMHFMTLFAIEKLDHIIPQMNEIYASGYQMKLFVLELKKVLGMESCKSMQLITRKVKEMRDKHHGGCEVST